MKKLAIVGSDPASRHLAPFEDTAFDIWVFNEAANHEWCKRWTAVFQMHDPNIYTGHNTKDPKHWEWLQQCRKKPIYMQDIDPLVPDGIRYPIEDALKLAGAEMFTTTFAYMAALAILQGYEYIEIHGMGLSASEYDYQKFGYAYWMGFLRGKLGADNVVNTITHVGADLFNSPRYGYEGNFSFGAEYFMQRSVFNENNWKAAEKSLNNLTDATLKAIRNYDFNKVPELAKELQAAALLSGEHAGALSESDRYQKFGSRYADRGGFENAAAKAQNELEAKRILIWHFGGMVEYVWNVWNQSNNQTAAQQLRIYIQEMVKRAYEAGAMLGVYKENIEYLKKYDVIANAGGRVLIEA